MKSLRKWCIRLALVIISLLLVLGLVVLGLILNNGRTGAKTDFSDSDLFAKPPAPLEEALTIKIITFNIADAYLFTNNRPERMRAIGAKLTELDPDLVVFQEAFIAKDRAILCEALADSRLKHHAIYPAATMGNGLLISSAWPIREVYFHRYEHSNPWWRIGEGDWWVGKGVGLARVELPGGNCIDLYNTHAQSGRISSDYRAVRRHQMAELATFLNTSHTPTAPAFIGGDFNTALGQEDMELAISEAGLQRVMSLDSLVDHIFAIQSPLYTFETIETVAINETIQGSHPSLFLGRAPTLSEYKTARFGPPGETRLSDHDGYMSTIRITCTSQI